MGLSCIVATFNENFLQDPASNLLAALEKKLEEKLNAQEAEIRTLQENRKKNIDESSQLRKMIKNSMHEI